MSTATISIESPEQFAAAVQRAAALLRQGEIVAVPTETVYGLAADARCGEAVNRLFVAKGRPPSNPIIVHVGSERMAGGCAERWPESARTLSRAFWPGPLTLVVTKSASIHPLVTAGGGTVGIRWPRHPYMQALIDACGFPLAAPSANASGSISPTRAEHVEAALRGRIPLIVDGGPSAVGIESTVLDLTGAVPSILRPGMIDSTVLAAVLGVPVCAGGTGVADGRLGSLLRSPGQLAKHYAPRARLKVWRWSDEPDLQSRLRVLKDPVALDQVHILTHHRIPIQIEPARVWVLPHDPDAFARALYTTLHGCDACGAALIVVEQVPSLPEWAGIADRLQRAAS